MIYLIHISCKPSIYNKIDDRIYYNCRLFKYSDSVKILNVYENYNLKTNNYELINERPSLDDSNNGPFNYDFHTIKINLLEYNINSGSITKYETNKT